MLGFIFLQASFKYWQALILNTMAHALDSMHKYKAVLILFETL